MGMPLVSIGVPTYNCPQGLRRSLECICSQAYKNLEIIVSDNCSPDPSVEATVREFSEKDRRIKYFRQEENKGMVFNFQFVISKATGDYFMWLADDDWFEESSYIERCALFLKDHSDF
ncbi:MAG: glycosyltransferase family 2 protein, partial [Candidatus Omnitrophota bacterium]